MDAFEGTKPPARQLPVAPESIQQGSFEAQSPHAAVSDGKSLAVGVPALPEFTSPLSFANLCKALRHRYLLAATAGLTLCFAFAFATWYFCPAKYTAYALLRVAAFETDLIPDARGLQTVQMDRNFETTQAALIKSRPIILAALQRPGISDLEIVRDEAEPAEWLEEKLKVGFLDKTDILKVSLDGTRPEGLAKLVNAVKDAYMEEAVNAQRNQKLALLDELEKINLSSDEKIRNQRTVLRQLAETLKSSDSQALSVKQKAALDEYVAQRKELLLLQAQLRTAQTALVVQKTSAKPGSDLPIGDFLTEQYVESDLLVQQKKLELSQLDSKVALVARQLAPGHPTLTKHQQERKVIEAELAKVRAAQRARVVVQLRERLRSEMEARGQQSQENVEVLQREVETLKGEVARLGEEAQKIGLTSFELELKRKEIEDSEAVFKRIRQEKERLQVEVQSTKQRVNVLYSAEVPCKKNLAAQARLIGFAGFGGLLLGLFGVGLWEARSRRIMTKDEVVSELGMRVVGVLPWIEPAERRGDRAAKQTKVLSEAVDSIRTLLLCHSERQATGRVLMVSSAVAQEGKTTLASHLAVSLAGAGRKTLLVDCDFRRPELHHVFDFPLGPGLCEVLRQEASRDEAIRATPVERLSLLTVGENSRDLNLAMAVDEIHSLVEEFRQRFDFVLIDSCPVLPVADALMIGNRVDGVLLSIRPRLSQLPEVHAAYERLAVLRIPVIGAVVNGERARTRSSEYKYLLESKVG